MAFSVNIEATVFDTVGIMVSTCMSLSLIYDSLTLRTFFQSFAPQEKRPSELLASRRVEFRAELLPSGFRRCVAHRPEYAVRP